LRVTLLESIPVLVREVSICATEIDHERLLPAE
jgi:hypothetical protein